MYFYLPQNPLQTRSDLERILIDLLAPLKRHKVPGGYLLGSTDAHYAPKVAAMEGFNRSLWGIGALIAGGGTYPDTETACELLRQGVDPNDAGYWGEPGDKDQRLVEMASIALSLVIARETFWNPLNEEERRRLYTWLSVIEKRELPSCNWHFFRIMVCTAFRELGLPVDERAEQESFDAVESYYRGDGWYQDGPQGSYDYYNPMGFHFYGLIYAKLAGYRDPKRAALYIERAGLFAPRFAAWSADDGSTIPYGRSLTYRFAALSFFSACAFADLEALPWGVMKGLILRNLRRWQERPILDSGGILSIGYGYANIAMADSYNSPGSPYWSLKVFLILALGENHPFWQAQETGLEPFVVSEKIPAFIVSRTKEDAQVLVAGRYPNFEMNYAEQKYGKFVYSARFGFCTGEYCDSALLLSEDEGYWRGRREVYDQKTGEDWTIGTWNPWQDVTITTKLIRLRDWHIRIHRIQSARRLKVLEGGFPLRRYNGMDEPLAQDDAAHEKTEARAIFPWGASRIIALDTDSRRTGLIVSPAPNRNILYPSVIIPALEGTIEPGLTILICAVIAGGQELVMNETIPKESDYKQ
ncbi:MAG: DUF2264 domain-containing protein [Spirochaetaceae bacterium]|jgi:hypothetical protein|nr:DUF2264 domain-containing protein [Spirochaetaceae bacterium]